MMKQWHSCKERARQALLLFRMGDFYEAFYDDAALISKELDVTLTQRQGIPMSGVPCHTAESYIDKLVAKGYRVAIAEQMEDPKKVKGLVKREVVRVVTPGTVVNSSLLTDKANNFIAALAQVDRLYGLAFLDLTTGEFKAAEFDDLAALTNELYRLRPSELVTSDKFNTKHISLIEEIKRSFSVLLSPHEEWHFDFQTAYTTLVSHFKVHSLDGFGLKGMTASVNAAGALLTYLQDKLSLPIDHIRCLTAYSSQDYLVLDESTQRNLELTESLKDSSAKNTLLSVLDRTHTPMGGRLIRSWIKQPLLSVDRIIERQEGIEAFLNNRSAAEEVAAHLEGIRDLERLMMKITAGYASPRDVVALRLSLERTLPLKKALAPLSSPLLQQKAGQIADLTEVIQRITTALVDEPPLRLGDGRSFREGYHRELDELREISRDSKNWIARYQSQLREETGIKTLKLGFNRMFGYYIEVSRGQADQMPATFQRRQTLVNAERFISPELKELEHKVLNAEERIEAIEAELFRGLLHAITPYMPQITQTAQALAHVDCLCGLAEVAGRFGYIRPTVDEGDQLEILEGRHPVIEAIHLSEKFVPNDTLLDPHQRLLVITGPNMAGKSTYIRQVALLTLMAHIGSFIPAKAARIGLVDKIFTRIGASDDLTRGQSTFMVEMAETAHILHHATSRSLVILDEIGRGTSTYDGISIAWAVAEHLLTTPGKTAKTLFATHYWELTQLEGRIFGAVNYNVAVCEHEDEVIFLRKIVPGSTDKSYGIHVGRLAGLPDSVVGRAREILAGLEEGYSQALVPSGTVSNKSKRLLAQSVKKQKKEVQLLLFESEK